MKHNKLTKSLGIFLSFVIFVFSPLTAQAITIDNHLTSSQVQIINLNNGYRIERSTEFITKTRSTIITKSDTIRLLDKNNITVCSFITYGDFDSNSKKCIKVYYNTTTTGGTWRVESPQVWQDTYAAYGSCKFVKRILGIQVNSIAQSTKVTLD